MIETTENIGKIYVEFSDQLSKTPELIAANVKEGKKKRKNLNNVGKKLVQELNKSESNVSKAKLNFYKLRKKQDESMEEYSKAKAIQTANVVTKLGKKADQDAKSAEKADKDYSETVKKHKELQEKFFKDSMPRLLQEFQIFEEDRIKNLKSHFEIVSSFLEPIPDNLRSLNQTLAKSIQSIDVDRDIGNFISKNKNSKTGPDYAVYEPYDSANSTTTSSDRGSIIVPASSSASFPVIRDNSSSNLNTSYIKSKSVTEKAGEKVKAVYDYKAQDENELSFKANEIISVLREDESGWWHGESASGATGIFPSNFVESIDASFNRKTCKAIYDYQKTDEDELPMKIGEKLTIDSEENGWFFCLQPRRKVDN